MEHRFAGYEKGAGKTVKHPAPLPPPARESGQAIMELLAMLLGLAVLIVGIVVFSAYQSAENTLLLRSKYRTEVAARSERR